MALKFIDSFDHYVTADLHEKWTTMTGFAISVGNGRRGTNSAQQGGDTNFLRQTLLAQPTWIVGCAMCMTARPITTAAAVWLLDDDALQLEIRFTNAGTIQVVRGGTLLGVTSGSIVVPLDTYFYLEFLATIHSSAGVAIVRLNGEEVLALTGQNTQVSANATANQVAVGIRNVAVSFGTQDIDDVYICDGTGPAPYNTFLGDCRVDCLFPNGDGASSAWTPSTGTAHSTLVDEAAPNDDTDYLYSNTSGARDTHAMTNLPTTALATIYGVQHSLNARKEDPGVSQVKNTLTSGPTAVAGTAVHTLSTSYRYYHEVWTADPNTGTAWTVAAIDAVEAGIEKV